MTKFGTRKKTAFAFWGAAFVLLIAIVFTACPNNSSGGTSEPIPPLALNEETFTKNEWEEFTYQLVTAGSGNYDAEPENPDIIKLYKVNLDSRGEIRIRCKNAGETRIKVTDMASGQTAFSGLITVKTSVAIPDYFEEDGVRYCITDFGKQTVSVTARTAPQIFKGYEEASLTIPKEVFHEGVTYTVTDIDDRPDAWGDRLQSITVAADNGYLSSQNGVIFNKDKTVLLWYPCGKRDADYTVPASVTILSEYSFYGVSALKAVTLPSGLKHIEGYVFRYCSNIEKLNLPSSLKSIGEYSLCDLEVSSAVVPEGIRVLNDLFFANCPKVETLELPSSLTRIGKYSFTDNSVLKNVTCKAEKPPIIAEDDEVFAGTPIASATLKVPADTENLYRAAEGWKDFGTIEEF